MNAEFAFRLLLGALSLAGCGLFFVFFFLFDDEREIDPIYREETDTGSQELHCDVA